MKRGRSAYKNRWIDEYKLKGGAWIVRSCLVAQELVTDGRNDTFVGTPPLKAVTLGLVLASTEQFRIEAEQKICSLHDVYVALFNASIDSEEPLHVIQDR